MNSWRDLCVHFGISVSLEQAEAMDTLEARGFAFCVHFGTDNAVKLLDGMDCAVENGTLYEWLAIYMGEKR